MNDALQHEGFAHLAALAPKPEPEPDGPLAEVVDLSARRRRAEHLLLSNANLPMSNAFVRQ